MKKFTLLFVIFVIMIAFHNRTFSQEIVFSKIFPLDSAVNTSSKIIKCSDGNILLTAKSQISYYSSKETLQNIKLDYSGNSIWNNKKNLESGYEVTDIFELDNNYYNAAATTVKIGQFNKNVQTVFKFDINGNDVYHKIDSFSNTSLFRPWFTKKINDNLISFHNGMTSGKPHNNWLYYDFESKFQSYKNIDTLYIPNLFQITGRDISITYDNKIIYSIAIYSTDTTSPLFYRIFNSEGELEKEFTYNEGIKIKTPSGPRPTIKLKNGDYLTSYSTDIINNIPMDFIKRVDSDGNYIWEDTLKNESVRFTKIIEDDFGNIIIAGLKRNKAHPIVPSSFINYFYLSCYDSNGTNKFKKVWGDSTVNNKLDDLIVTEDNNIIAVGSSEDMPYMVNISYHPTSVDDNGLKYNHIKLNPNPVQDIFTIEDYDSDFNYVIQIFNLHGIIVYESEFKEKIDVSDLLSGVYFIKIGSYYQKFIKL